MADKYRLPDDKIAQLQSDQRRLADLLPMIEDSEACGIECQEYRRVHGEAMERINKLLEKFGNPMNSRV